MDKPVRFDRHARRRMKWRKISEPEALTALSEPEKREPSVHGRINHYKKVGRKYLKVTFKEFPDEFLVVSVVDKGDGR